MSVSAFRALFHSATGCSPKKYIEHARLRKAEYLLTTTTLSVKQVMAQVGFSDASDFSRMFKKAFGASPTAYRKQAGPQSAFTLAREDFCSHCPLRGEITNRLAILPTESRRQARRRSA